MIKSWEEIDKKIRLLFCFGSPKSGTTFLQMILNAHPEVSCPSEHQFDFFIRELPKLLDNYNKILDIVDKRTGNQGPAFFTGEDLDQIFKYIVKIAAIRGAQGRNVKWYGINDNAIINKLDIYNRLFPEAIFICIVRDPRSITISSWYHNIRVEPNFIARRGKKIEYWSKQVASFWVRDINNVLNFSKKNPDKLFICRYEDLVLNPEKYYIKLFEFLDVNSSDKIVHEIIKKTNFRKFKDGKFFRKASIDDWKEELSQEAIINIEKIALSFMKHFGYEPFLLKE